MNADEKNKRDLNREQKNNQPVNNTDREGDLGGLSPNLNYNEEENSFEYDVKGENPDYDHPDPYNTLAKNGEDINSTYDEANPYAADEYIPNESLETDVDKLGMHIDDGKIVKVSPADAAISRTPEDDRDDLDEEGYPKNDRAK